MKWLYLYFKTKKTSMTKKNLVYGHLLVFMLNVSAQNPRNTLKRSNSSVPINNQKT